MDITQLILDDHYEQRRLFAILEQVGNTDREALAELHSSQPPEPFIAKWQPVVLFRSSAERLLFTLRR